MTGAGPPVTVAVLGLGEAGGRIAQDLAAAGARVRGFDPAVPAPPGVEPAADDADACRGADLVLSLTTAGESEDALRQALAGLSGPGGTAGAGGQVARTAYADANTAAAGLKQRLAGLAGQAGVPFADVAIMAPVPPRGLRTPMLASGQAAAEVARLLGGCGASVAVLPGPPGAAATRKLLRSVFYKGMAAAVVEALRAAEAAGQARLAARAHRGRTGRRRHCHRGPAGAGQLPARPPPRARNGCGQRTARGAGRAAPGRPGQPAVAGGPGRGHLVRCAADPGAGDPGGAVGRC